MASREWLGSKLQSDRGGFRSLDFSGVSTRAFPLRANIAQLQIFCDQYLNLAPEIASFRPIAPFVLFQVLNYGRMSPTTANLGWVAQHEVLFLVPVVGHWPQDGKQVEGFASVTPFIFVDNDWSIASGREIYGWPKYPARLVPEVNTWIQDPRLDRRLLTLKTHLFPRLYAGRPQELLTLLELVQKPPSFAQWPPDMNYLMGPLTQMPQALFGAMSSMPDMFRNLTSLWSPGGASDLSGLFQGQLQALLNIPQQSLVNTLNLKQFRSSNPEEAAYQALVNGVMEITATQASGMLGSVDLMRGDPTCGFKLLVHHYPDFPIVEALGLEVESEFNAGGVRVSALKPFFPYWTILDMRYRTGKRLLWRTKTTGWAAENEPPPKDPPNSPAYFNSTLGPVVEAVRGPFDFFDATMRILPIKAKDTETADEGSQKQMAAALQLIKEQLEGLEESLNGALKLLDYEHTVEIEVEFLPWVFVIVKNFGTMSSKANDLGWWGGRSVDFARILKLRVKEHREEGTLGKTQWGGLEIPFIVIPYAFADNPLAVSAGSEVLGLPTAFARIEPGVDPWIKSTTPAIDRCLLGVTIRDYPALGVGQEAAERCLFEIHQLPPPKVARSKEAKAEQKAERKRAALIDDFRDQYREEYQDGVMLSYVTLKQFRDEEQPELICYRALESHERLVGKWAGRESGEKAELEELPGTYEIRFNNLPSWPVIETLGLEVDRWEVSDLGVKAAVCKVRHPHWVKADLRWNLPMTLRWQSVDGEWRTEYLPLEASLGTSEEPAEPVSVGSAYLAWLVWRMTVNEIKSDWAGKKKPKQAPNMTDLYQAMHKEVFEKVEQGARAKIAPFVDLSMNLKKEPKGLSDVLRDFEKVWKAAQPDGDAGQSEQAGGVPGSPAKTQSAKTQSAKNQSAKNQSAKTPSAKNQGAKKKS